MELQDILSQYSDENLDRLAQDKVDEVSSLRLPRAVLIQEIVAALSSLSYVARILAPSRPPTYAFLKILMDAPDHIIPINQCRTAVIERTNRLAKRAESRDSLPKNKDFDLYLMILYAAWEDDGYVDRSEALLLGALRKELGIWMREHLFLEHHPLVRPVWDTDTAFEDVRDHLLSTGLVLIHGEYYVLANSVREQIRRTWEIDLEDDSYARLLNQLSNAKLRQILESSGLRLSGTKEDRVEAIIRGLVPPTEILISLSLPELKDLAQNCRLRTSFPKAELLSSIIACFDSGQDITEEQDDAQLDIPEPDPEDKELDDQQFRTLFEGLTGDLLYDILASKQLYKSGSKIDRVHRLFECRWSERSLLSSLRHTDLSGLCRKHALPIYGLKRDIIDRLIAWAKLPRIETESTLVKSSDGLHTEVSESAGSVSLDPPEHPTVSPEPPPGLDEIVEAYPELNSGEQIVLALLREAKSLSDREISRVAHRYSLAGYSLRPIWQI